MVLYCCMSIQPGHAQDQSKIDTGNTHTIVLPDSLPGEFMINISDKVVACDAAVFDQFKENGAFQIGDTQNFKNIKISPSLLHPVNEIVLFFSIHNASAKERLVYFSCGAPDLSELASLDDPAKKIIQGGFTGTDNRISPFSPNKYFPVFLPANTSRRFLFHAKFMGSAKEIIVPMLLSERTYQLNSIHNIDKTRFQLIYHSFIMGGIFIISIFMFAQYFLNRDKTYLSYSAYGLCIFLLSEKIMESNCNINLVSYFFPYYVFYSHVILQLLASYFYISFLKRLLGISVKEKRLYLYCNTLQLLILAGCVINIIPFFTEEDALITTIAYNYGVLVSTFAMLPLLIMLMMLKGKTLPVKFVIAGFSAVVIATLLVVYINRSGLYVKFNLLAPISIFEFGIFLEMVFFGLALGYKTYMQKKEKERIELQKKETEIAALKAQMNPHFIFNCINSIDAFIQSNDKYNATLYLNKFARLIRNVLESSKQNLVPFSKDIETLKLYIELEQLRSDAPFATDILIDEELMTGDYKVPSLIVQPFIENAIIHGLRNKESGDGLLSIHINRAGDNIIYVITDNGVGRKAAAQGGEGKDKSYGMQMSFDRIKLFNQQTTSDVEVTDLYKDGVAAGTQIIIQLKII